MNKEQMKKFKEEDPNFESRVVYLPIKDLTFDRYESQVRDKGHELSTAENFTGLFKNNGGKWLPGMPPITTDPEGLVREGNTRALGALGVDENMEVATYTPLDCENWTDLEWKIYQAEGNDHPEQNPNTRGDIKKFVASVAGKLGRQYNKGKPYPTGQGIEKQDAYVLPIAKRCKEIYKNSSVTTTDLKKYAKDAFEAKVLIGFDKLSPEQIKVAYKAEVGCSEVTIGQPAAGASKNVPMLRIAKPDRLYPNLEGYVSADGRGKYENPLDVVVYYDKNLSALSDRDFIKERLGVVAGVLKMRQYFNDLPNRSQLFRDVYVADQVKNGAYADTSANGITLVTDGWISRQMKLIK